MGKGNNGIMEEWKDETMEWWKNEEKTTFQFSIIPEFWFSLF
jgi:hypothetical protein